jgi:hypothetical protein
VRDDGNDARAYERAAEPAYSFLRQTYPAFVARFQQMPCEVAGQLPALILDTSNNFLWADNPTRTVRT